MYVHVIAICDRGFHVISCSRSSVTVRDRGGNGAFVSKDRLVLYGLPLLTLVNMFPEWGSIQMKRVTH